MDNHGGSYVMTTTTHLAISGPFDLREIALMGFGHRDERSFDGVMRMAASQAAYGIDHELSDAELLALAESWRPFRTWVSVMMRAVAGRTSQ
jgi:DNA-3-methyladenine glycosylase II